VLETTEKIVYAILSLGSIRHLQIVKRAGDSLPKATGGVISLQGKGLAQMTGKNYFAVKVTESR